MQIPGFLENLQPLEWFSLTPSQPSEDTMSSCFLRQLPANHKQDSLIWDSLKSPTHRSPSEPAFAFFLDSVYEPTPSHVSNQFVCKITELCKMTTSRPQRDSQTRSAGSKVEPPPTSLSPSLGGARPPGRRVGQEMALAVTSGGWVPPCCIQTQCQPHSA